MSRSSEPGDPTALVLAAVGGLSAAGLGVPLLAAAVPALGRSWPMRIALGLTAAGALLWGDARVASLSRHALDPGSFGGLVTVTQQPSAGRAIASVAGSGESVVLHAPDDPIVQGGRYRVRGRLQPLDAVVRSYYATQGVRLELRAETVVAAGRRGGVWGIVDDVHRWALDRLGDSGHPSAERALVAGIVLGDAGSLPTLERNRLRSSGLYHIVAVSGQNVALVTLFIVIGLGLAGVIGRPARAAAIAAALAYTLVTGAGPSIVRAGVAGTLIGAAWLASRPVRRWHLLACGAAIVLAFNPLELADPGFQLSFAAVAAIYLVAPRLQPALGQAVAISVACTVVTTPISWWHFGRLAPLAVPANLLALPVVAPVLWLGVAAVLAGSLWPPLAHPLLALADLLSAYLLWVAGLCA